MYRLFLLFTFVLLSGTAVAQADSTLYYNGKLEEKVTQLEKDVDRRYAELTERLELKKENLEYQMSTGSWILAAVGVLVAIIGLFVGRSLHKEIKEKTKEIEKIRERAETILGRLEDRKDAFDKKIEDALAKIDKEASSCIQHLKNMQVEGKEHYDKLMTYSAEPTTDKEREKGIEKMQEIQKSKDSTIFEKDWAEAHEVYFSQRDMRKAAQKFVEILDKYSAILTKPQLEDIYFRLGTALLDFDKCRSLALLDLVTTLNPNYSKAWYNKGNLLADMQEYDKALEAYNKAIDLKPSYAEAWYNKGNLLMEMNDSKAALECFRNALKYGSDNPLIKKKEKRIKYWIKELEEKIKGEKE